MQEAVCREGKEPVLYEGQMQSFSLPDRYGAIIIPTGSFLLLEKREESLKALQCFHEHLSPGGRLILDIFLQTDFKTDNISTKSWTTPDGDLITMETTLVEVDFINQYTVSYLKYEKWRDGKLMRSELQRFPLRWYGLEEFKLVLEKTGFSDIVISADYIYGKQPSAKTGMLTFEAVRL